MKIWISLLMMPLFWTACQHAPRSVDREVIPISPLQFSEEIPVLDFPDDGVLSLVDAVRVSLGRNRDLAVRELAPAVAAAELEREEGTFGTHVFGETALGEENASETSRSSGERFAVEAETRQSELGLSRNFSTGTDLTISFREEEDRSNRAPAQQELRLGLELTQSLLRGRGRSINRIAIQQAGLGVQISREELRGYVQALISETETAYWQVQLAQEAVDITRQALEVADQQLSEILQRIELGQLAPDEEFAARAERSSRLRDRVDAEATLDDRALVFARLLARPSEAGLRWQLDTPLQVTSEAIEDAAPLIEQAMRLNPALREARIRLEQNELEVIGTQNGLLPRLDFFTRLDKTGFGGDMTAAREDFSGASYEWVAGIQVLHELGTGAGQADRRLAGLEREQAERAVENLEELLANDLHRAVVEHNRALRQIAISQDTLRLRQATAEAERARFEVGTSTSLLVAQAQREALESQINELENRILYRRALIRVQTLTGDLLIRYGVEVGAAE